MARIPKAFNHLLQRTHGRLGRLLGHVHEQQSLLHKIRPQLPPELRPHCLHAEFNRGELQLFLDSSAWAHRAQYLGPELVAKLDEAGHRGIQRLRVRVLPVQGASSGGRRRTMSLSAESAGLLEATARTVSDPSLRKSLFRLAQHRRPKGD